MSKAKKKSAPAANVKSIVEQVHVRDFYGTRKVFFIISGVLMALVLALCFIRGVNVSIEFRGGTMATYSYSGTVDENKIRDIAQESLGTSVRTQLGETFTGEKQTTFTLSFNMDTPFDSTAQQQVLARFQEEFPDSEIEALESSDIAPSSGKQFLAKCTVAALFAAVVLILYIAWRFNRISGWSAGIFAVVALLHDLVVVFGTFVACGYELDSNFMAVILTILGYSVNDTIVIYDRIRENQAGLKNTPLPELVNISLSQTMRRTIRTSVTTIAAMLIVSILAAVNNVTTILHFSIPLTVGMVSGCYSSLCLAPMLWLAWKQRGQKTEKTEKAGKETAKKAEEA